MSWESLRRALEDTRLLLEELRGRGGLRHGLSYLRVSDLVEQARCEARLEALLGEERVIDERVKLVDQLVKLVLGAKRRIARDKHVFFLDAPIAGVVGGVPIVGRPKALIAREGVIEGIVYASLSSKPDKIYDQDRVRAAAFCAALYSSPLPTSHSTLYYHVKAADRAALAQLVEKLRSSIESGERMPLEKGIHVIACDEEAARKTLEPLLAYWLGLRDALRRPGPWCRDCPLRDSCPLARV